MKASEGLIRVALALEGIHEVGFGNRGPAVEQLQGADDIPGGGYAWCVDVWQWAARELGLSLGTKTASVGVLEGEFRRRGWLYGGPRRGALGFWRIGGDSWPDHIFGVTRVLRLGPWYALRTIEGNTSRDDSGSQDNGGWVAQRTRVIHRSKVMFGTVPFYVSDKVVDAAEWKALLLAGDGWATRRQAAKMRAADTKLYFKWLRWRKGHGEFKRRGRANPRFRPKSLPARIPDRWWRRLRGKGVKP